MRRMTLSWRDAAGVWLVLAALCFAAVSPAHAEEDRDTRRVETLDPRVAQSLLGAYEKLHEGQAQQALSELNTLIERQGRNMKPFDMASVLQIRGSAQVHLERYQAAVQDFQRALELDALPREQSHQLRFNLAQLYFQLENWQRAIALLQQWMQEEGEVPHSAWFMLSAAYYYQNDHARAREPVLRAIQAAPQPERRYYDLANIIYAELNQPGPRRQILERLVQYWPGEQSYWKQLAALHMEQGREREAFTTLELAYKSGLIDEESDLVALAQLYSVQHNPHRGAALLEKELQAGRVTRNVRHLELLSQLWSQAREHRKAIPVLEEAARLSDTGMLSYRLGQVLLSDEQNAPAERALMAAINKGGLTEAAQGDAWMLLGTARFNQAGPGERDQRMAADQAFASAQRYASTRRQAGDWRNYIRAINDTEDRQAALETEQSEALAEAARQREVHACRAQQLAGRTLTEECQDVLAGDN